MDEDKDLAEGQGTAVRAAEQSAAGQAAEQTAAAQATRPTKFCSHCGRSIDAQAVICPLCGCQVEQMTAATPNIVINNANNNTNTQVQKQTTTPVVVMGHPKSKWVAVLLCLFLGALGGHKFYEGKVGMGILYCLTGGLFAVGIVVDLITLLLKPDPYYV